MFHWIRHGCSASSLPDLLSLVEVIDTPSLRQAASHDCSDEALKSSLRWGSILFARTRDLVRQDSQRLLSMLWHLQSTSQRHLALNTVSMGTSYSSVSVGTARACWPLLINEIMLMPHVHVRHILNGFPKFSRTWGGMAMDEDGWEFQKCQLGTRGWKNEDFVESS